MIKDPFLLPSPGRGQDQQGKWMFRAILLAEKGRYRTSPNPMVGACVVYESRLVGEGYHREFGGDHAEITALKKAGPRARGATLYVTLEPCASWGKTPPCVNAIVQSGIHRVVIGSLDPNPSNHGKGISALKKAGLEVQTGILSRKVQSQNEAFFKYVKTHLPFVTLKMAQSLDGKIATRKGDSRWISSYRSRQLVRSLRAEQDAVLVGRNTVLLDNPRLGSSRHAEGRPSTKPWRVILDPYLEVPARARVFCGKQLTLVAVSEAVMKQKMRQVPKGDSSRVFLSVPAKKDRLDLKNLLKQLAALGAAKLFVEGGGELAWSFIREGLVDRAYWFVAPKIVGGAQAKTSVEGEGVSRMAQALPCSLQRSYQVGRDWLLVTDF